VERNAPKTPPAIPITIARLIAPATHNFEVAIVALLLRLLAEER
jgi:hypothetical protein